MVDLGLSAGLAFTVGLGILPVIGGITSLNLVERRKEPAYRAFAAFLGASIFCVVMYTAVKAAYLSTVFSTLTEERNMIYLSPLMLIGTALVLQAKKIDWRLVAARDGARALPRLPAADAAGLPLLRGAGLRDPHDPEPALGLGRPRPAVGARRRPGPRARPARVPPAHGRRRRGRRALLRVDADRPRSPRRAASPTSRTSSTRSCRPSSTGSTRHRAGSPSPTSARSARPTTRTACCSPSSGTARCGTSTAWTASPRARARRAPRTSSRPTAASRASRPTRQYILADIGVNVQGPVVATLGRQARSTARTARGGSRTPSSRCRPTAGRRTGRPTPTSGPARAARST